MILDQKPVLNLVDKAACLSAIQFIPLLSTEDIWEPILYCWMTLYSGLTPNFLLGEGSKFQNTFAEISVLDENTVYQSCI